MYVRRGLNMAVTHYSIYRSGHYKAVKNSIDIASELNSANVSKRYYSNNVEESDSKTFVDYLLEQLIFNFGSDYFYRTEVVEVFNPVKSQVNTALQADQDLLEGVNIRGFEHLLEINIDFIANLYPERFKSFEDTESLFEYLCSYPTIKYIFDYKHIEIVKGYEVLENYKSSKQDI